MLIGIVADIHEHTENLQAALREFQRRGAERVVNLGDACDTFTAVGRSLEVVQQLRAANAVGVWGNHDVGLCLGAASDQEIMRKAAPEVLDFMQHMRPQLVLEYCRFSHMEPWLDPTRIDDLWYFDGRPDTIEKAARSFSAVPERVLFLGHFHCWLAMTPSQRLAWNGETPLQLEESGRYLVVVAPLVDGWCAVFDTKQAILTPCHVGSAESMNRPVN